MSAHRRRACVVVDAYSTGNALPNAFRAYGCDTIHVASDANLPAALSRSFRPADFALTFDYDGDLDRLCAALLAAYPDVLCVVAASEPGVLLADQLSEQIGLPGNGTALSRARRDKSLMAQVVAAAGLPVIPHLTSSDPREIRKWVAGRRLGTVIMKPVASSGTVGFHIVEAGRDLEPTLAGLLGSQDAFGEVVDRVLVQPYVDGNEYCVNAVSCDGSHLVSEVYRTRKRRCGESKVYDVETLVDPTSPAYDEVVGYARRVLTALGITFGPSHTEIIVGNRGPTLIESAARFMGALDIALIARATGTTSVLLTAESYLAPERFLRRLDEPARPLTCQTAAVQLLSTTRGHLVRWNVAALAELDSFHGVDTYLAPGDEVVPTVDSFSSPGLVFLAAPTTEAVHKDYLHIRRMEAERVIYEVAAAEAA